MKANNTHISLRTAMLLKVCGVESDNSYDSCNVREDGISEYGYTTNYGSYADGDDRLPLPAYTWPEILWEHVDKFFGKGISDRRIDKVEILHSIVVLLQQKKYKEADKYFRKHCIFLKK